METINNAENLRRVIGIRAFTLTIINGMVGAGIFVLPALAAENLGAASIIAYLICGISIFLIALCFAEVGSKFSSSGGIYNYIGKAFGPYAGFLANNLFWIGCCVIADAAVANAIADALKYFIPSLDHGIMRTLFLVFLFGGLALVNIRSVKTGVGVVAFATLGKIIPLVLLVIAGAGFIKLQNLHWVAVPTIHNLGAASLLLFFAFTGVETPVSNGGEFKNPSRTVPVGILLGIFLVVLLYICIQLVSQGILGASLSQHKEAPLAAVTGIIIGGVGTTLMIVVTIISMAGGIAGEIVAIPRILFAGARDGLMPAVLGKVHPKYLTPYIAIAFYSSLGLLFSISGQFKQLAVLSVAATLIIYLGVVLATIKLRKRKADDGTQSFRIPGGIIVPVLAIFVIMVLLSQLSKQEVMSLLAFVVVFSSIYYLLRFGKRKRPILGYK